MNWTISQTVDLSRGYTPVVWPDALMVSGDVGAHTWRVAVLDNGVPANLSGANITGSFLRDDGATVQVAGSVLGNVASVTLTDACYAVEGKLVGTMRAVIGGATVTLAAVVYTVKLLTSGDVVDPGVAYQDFTIDASPAGTYADLAALDADDPDHSKIYITLNDGNWCYHNGTTWVAGGVYQATGIADGVVTPAKTSFASDLGKNLFNYQTVTPGMDIDSLGRPAASINHNLSDFMPVTPETQYIFQYSVNNRISFYKEDKTHIGRQSQSAAGNISPADAAFARISIHNYTYVPLGLIQFEAGTKKTDFEPYGSAAKTGDLANLARSTIYDKDTLIFQRVVGSGVVTDYADIYVPVQKERHYLRIRLRREINAEKNLNAWTTSEFAIYTREGVDFTQVAPLTQVGEFDLAIRITGAPDFIGGGHGDEVMQSAASWLVDGKPSGFGTSALVPTLCREVRLTTVAEMYDPSDGTTSVGMHYKEWVITAAGMEMRQRVVFSKALSMQRSFLAMLPALRKSPPTTGEQITDRGYNNFDYIHYDISEDGNGQPIATYRPGVTRQVVYSTTSGAVMECEVFPTPRLPGIDGHIVDVPTYNKMYFSFCPTGYQVAAGEVWENLSIYRVRYA